MANVVICWGIPLFMLVPHMPSPIPLMLAAPLVAAWGLLSFLKWVYIAYGNLPILGGHPKSTPGMAVAGFFIPLVGIVHPLAVMMEIASGGSEPEVGPEAQQVDPDSPADSSAVSAAVGWYFLCLATGALSLFASTVTMAQVAEQQQAAAISYLLALVALTGSGLLLIWLVSMVSAAQATKAAPKQ